MHLVLSLNQPDTLAEVQALFSAYEDALMRNDRAALNAFFWSHPAVTRYGIADRQWGHEELVRYRAEVPDPNFTRVLHGVRISTFGTDTAVVMCRVPAQRHPLARLSDADRDAPARGMEDCLGSCQHGASDVRFPHGSAMTLIATPDAEAWAGLSLADRAVCSSQAIDLRLCAFARRSVFRGELSERIRVSRTPLRQALQRLQGEGFLQVFPKTGWQVAPLNFDTVSTNCTTCASCSRPIRCLCCVVRLNDPGSTSWPPSGSRRLKRAFRHAAPSTTWTRFSTAPWSVPQATAKWPESMPTSRSAFASFVAWTSPSRVGSMPPTTSMAPS